MQVYDLCLAELFHSLLLERRNSSNDSTIEALK